MHLTLHNATMALIYIIVIIVVAPNVTKVFTIKTMQNK